MEVLIADDHELVRKGLRLLVQRIESNSIIFEAGTFTELKREINKQHNWELLIIDISMPGSNQLQGIEVALSNSSQAPVVVISGSEESDIIRETLKLGAKGFLPKSSSADIMEQAIKLVMAGGRYIPDSALDLTLEDYVYSKNKSHDSLNIPGLTKRQNDVALLLTKGKANKEIGRDLDISEATVRTHMTAIFKILEVNNRTQAVLAINQFITT
jgi:DNA-binding NarL/FixJ family response regulator